MPTGHHPHHQRAGAAKAGRQDKQDDKQLLIALVARQMREQQLARASYKISGHSIKNGVSSRGGSLQLMCHHRRDGQLLFISGKRFQCETHCGGSKSTKPVENKMGSRRNDD